MSWRALVLLLAPVLTGCVEKDPVWDLPCEDRPAREVLPGTGEEEFRSLDDNPLFVEYGDQGGTHIWFAVRLHGFGPNATIQFGITDAQDPAVIYSGPLVEAQKLEYNAEEKASEARGLFAFLEAYDEVSMTTRPLPSGKTVVLWADVSDECTPEAVHGEATGEVQ